MKRVMLDLETLSSDSNAAILSIGAAIFTETEVLPRERQFYLVIDAERSVLDYDRTKSAETMEWWSQQSPEARSVFEVPGIGLQGGLRIFRDWFCDEAGTSTEMWGNGSDFDNVILSNAFRAVKMKQPWSHRNNRCFRTLCSLLPSSTALRPVRTGVHHNALDDAVYQAQCAIEAFNILRGKHERNQS